MIRMLAICMMCFQSTTVFAQDYDYQPTVDLIDSYIDSHPASDEFINLLVDVINHPENDYTHFGKIR